MNLPMNNATMSSREVAEYTGKPHNDVLKAIRAMEPAWAKVRGGKFSLMFNYRELPNGGKKKEPYYYLTKTEWFYVATKFNDEARAKLVLRWEALEHQARVEFEAYNRRLEGLENGMSALMGAMTSLTNAIAGNYQTVASHKKEKKPMDVDVIDARHLKFDFAEVMGENIRHIVIENKDWYSLNDVLVNMRVSTGSTQIAKKLNRNMACKIWLYGNTHPAWFVSKDGLEIVLKGSRKLRNDSYFTKKYATSL